MTENSEISTSLGYITVEDMQIGQYVGMGMGVAGVALIISIAVLGIVSWFRR